MSNTVWLVCDYTNRAIEAFMNGDAARATAAGWNERISPWERAGGMFYEVREVLLNQ